MIDSRYVLRERDVIRLDRPLVVAETIDGARNGSVHLSGLRLKDGLDRVELAPARDAADDVEELFAPSAVFRAFGKA
jgi:hypothetical protein